MSSVLPLVCVLELTLHARRGNCSERSLEEAEGPDPTTIIPVSPTSTPFSSSSLVLQLSRVIRQVSCFLQSRARRPDSARGAQGRTAAEVLRGPPNRAGDEPARGGRRAAASLGLAGRPRVGRSGGGSPRAPRKAAEQGAQSPGTPGRHGAPRRPGVPPFHPTRCRTEALSGPGGKTGEKQHCQPRRAAGVQGAPRAALEPPPPPSDPPAIPGAPAARVPRAADPPWRCFPWPRLSSAKLSIPRVPDHQLTPHSC